MPKPHRRRRRKVPKGPQVPRTDKRLMTYAGLLLAVPVVALLAVPLYARDEPEIGGIPFFFVYQFAWVFLCAGFTFAAYRLTLAARRTKKGPRR